MRDAPAPADQDLPFLDLVQRHPGITPSSFAYLALDAGLLSNRLGRRWSPQGAGRIGGGILARLERDQFVVGGGRYGREFDITQRGRAALRNPPPTLEAK